MSNEVWNTELQKHTKTIEHQVHISSTDQQVGVRKISEMGSIV